VTKVSYQIILMLDEQGGPGLGWILPLTSKRKKTRRRERGESIKGPCSCDHSEDG